MRIRLFGLLLVSLAISSVAMGCVRGAVDLPTLTREADLIVIGRAASVQELAAPSGHRWSVMITVNRAVKGKADGLLTVNLDDPENACYTHIPQVDEFGMCFLRRTDQGYSFLSIDSPFIVASDSGCLASGDDLSRVAAELSCVISSPGAATHDVLHALDGLRSIKTPSGTDSLRRATKELDYPLDVVAALYLLSRDDISGLPLVERALQYSPILEIQDYPIHSEFATANFLMSIHDRRAIPALTRLMSSPDAETRRGAANALRNTESANAVEPLVKALYDADSEVRWMAVMGLAGIAGPDSDGKSWYPARDEFQCNEDLYLQHWREWAGNQAVRPSARPRPKN
jgi:hypothetical protein